MDATPLNYSTMFTDSTANNKNNNYNSKFINTQETVNGLRILTKQNSQTQLHFINKN